MDNAVVGIITLGSSGILKMPLDQAAQQLGRTLLIAAATSASYATGIVCEKLDLPVAVTVVLCITVGTATSLTLNGKEGIFEWIVDPNPSLGVTHRRFIEGVGITGKPNAHP